MNPNDVAAILAKCAAYDNRTPAQATVAAWTEALEDMPVADALKFVADHYAQSREWIMPADLNIAWKRIRTERQRAISEAERPQPPQDATTEQFLAFRRGVTNAISRGQPVNELQAAGYAAIGRPVPVIEPTTNRVIDLDQIGQTA